MMIHATPQLPTKGPTMKMLLAVDGSAPALQAVRWALGLAGQGLAAEFVLVNVQEPASLYEVVTAHDADLIEQVRGAAGADLLREAESLLEAAGVGFESEVAGGTPEHLIVELAENYGCELIVMGARGMGDPEAGGLGSVAQAVLESATQPVVVVRTEMGEALPASDAVA
jgi:nucleotide-binding universal stress UspA family protein